MRKIMLIANDTTYVYNLRYEIITALLAVGYEVSVVCEKQLNADKIANSGAQLITLPIQRHSKNPFTDFKMMQMFERVIKRVQPEVVLTYNIKPNIYAGFVCKRLKIPYITNITGLGTAVEYPGLMQKLTTMLYRVALRDASCVFFQNKANMHFFEERHIAGRQARLLPGSGVNLKKFSLMDYPDMDVIHFIFVARILKEKGIDQYLEAAKIIRSKYKNTCFHVIGGCDDEQYRAILEREEKAGNIVYHGLQRDMLEFQKMSSCVVLPSYYPEGMNNTLLESAACGRPIITTARSGCGEIVEDGVTGFLVRPQDVQSLVSKLEAFIALPWQQRRQMGLAGRAKVEREYDRMIVVNAYLDEIGKLES